MKEHKVDFPYLDIFYIHHPHHRNSNPSKSQWSITEDDERSCFETIVHLIYHHGWGENNCCWGLYLENKQPNYLGHSALNSSQPNRSLFLAKFVDGDGKNKWHGYPADHVTNNQDIPTSELLLYWVGVGYLTRAQMRKIAKGQKCKL